ncbi:hypothetical protein [Anatilimnocola floriformis]|uniref:hypothetical protein n=1 Tax=Anatilimnocola floriformis TaxID=2948575 RepID=UPI0020C52FC8|nr:hypothetical protein [Anatilimnocola floriformis]
MDADPTTAVETTMPGDWSALGADFAGPAQFIRHFGLPTNLSQERVSLVIESVHARATIELNDQSLGLQLAAEGSRRYEVTGRLQLRNALRITLELAGQAGPGLLGEVRLEIED